MWPMGSQENAAEHGANRWLTEELPRELEHREQVREARRGGAPRDKGRPRLSPGGRRLLVPGVLAVVALVLVAQHQ
jgi:hypothetical protein